jgi:integrase
MTPECAAALREVWESAPPGQPLLKVPKKDAFRAHRQRAGVVPQDERGRWADFHSLRYTFCLWMSRLYPIEVVSKLMRHGSLNLTSAIYLDLGLDREGEGEWTLPPLLPPPAGAPGLAENAPQEGGEQAA